MADDDTRVDLPAIQQEIAAGRFDVALADLDRLLGAEPDNVEALYMTAVCRRYRREFPAALEAIVRLKKLSPEHGRAHQEEGHTYRDMGRGDDALRAYALACRFNPALVAAWREQVRILEANGRQAQAGQVRQQLEFVEGLAAPLRAVMDLIGQGRLLRAEEICRQYLQKAPQDVEGMRLLADIGIRLGVLDDAEFLLEAAVRFDPDNVPARIDYIQALRKRQKFREALEQANRLLDTAPDNPQFRSLVAIGNMQAGDYGSAIAAFDSVLERLPADPLTLTSKGHALKTSGNYEAAVDAYRAAIASQPQHGEAWYSLANLKVYEFSGDELAQMLAQLDKPDLSHADRTYLSFALGKAYEDRQEYAASFEHYACGNRLKKAQSRYDADTVTADLELQMRVCTRELFERRADAGHPAADPIFIVGLPRAGSTLLEQILSSHSRVDGTLELPNILSLAQRLRRRGRTGKGSRYPEVLAELDEAELAAFGEEYIRDTRIHRQGAPLFIDKMPNNFRHLGLIRLILPNAKIIDARRHPMACCFSGYKQLFAEGQEFSYDLADIGRYYRDYVALMDHWDEVLPGFALRVAYEDVVADLDSEVRRILDFCGLPFEEGCLEFYRTERSVRTPSSEQVRQPIYRSGLEVWRNYARWLDPLRDALGADVRHRFAIDSSVIEKGADRR